MSNVLKGDNGCEVEVICDSISPDNIRLTTLRLRYWRPIHSELMTHRVFSRNARSSRAVPVTTLLKEDMYIPKFMKNQPGMQAMEYLDDEAMEDAAHTWKCLALKTKEFVEELHRLGVHKQWANRPLEWFGWIDVLVTSTDWANWFALRDHPDAAPEIHELARLMHQAIGASEPQCLYYGDWHLPFITQDEKLGVSDGYEIEQLKVLSTARCARISYKPFDGNADYKREVERYNKLVVSEPVHASPAEHQATPDFKVQIRLGKGQVINCWQNPEEQGNFVGWIQNRKSIPNEAVKDAHYD